MQIDQLIHNTKLEMLDESAPLIESNADSWPEFSVNENSDHIEICMRIMNESGVVASQTRRVDILNG